MRKLILDIGYCIYNNECDVYRGQSHFDSSAIFEKGELVTGGWSIELRRTFFLNLPKIQVSIGSDVLKLTKEELCFITECYNFAIFRYDLEKCLSTNMKMIKGLNVSNSK